MSIFLSFFFFLIKNEEKIWVENINVGFNWIVKMFKLNKRKDLNMVSLFILLFIYLFVYFNLILKQ
jgi:hypothetical protein